ncbi:hypothetical protein NL676_002890 [Syzygium grande]|nr:hypothetical protein NL676_002890 [Syzygium grande]
MILGPLGSRPNQKEGLNRPIRPITSEPGLGFVLAAASTVFNLSSFLQSRAAPARSPSMGLSAGICFRFQ